MKQTVWSNRSIRRLRQTDPRTKQEVDQMTSYIETWPVEIVQSNRQIGQSILHATLETIAHEGQKSSAWRL